MRIVCVAVLFGAAAATHSGVLDRNAEEARWMVHEADWGYLSTLDSTKAPTASVASFSDGPVNASTGRLFFYLVGGLFILRDELTSRS